MPLLINHAKLNFISLIILISLSGCSRNQAPSCAAPKITSQLLELAKLNTANANFLSESISNIQTRANLQQRNLSCTATIHYHHSIFPEQDFASNYHYQVSATKLVSSFEYATGVDEVKFLQWFYALPNIVGYQKSRFGILAVLQLPEAAGSHNQIQQLSLNNTLINLSNENSYSTITLDKKFTLNATDVFLISAYYNSSNDRTSAHNYLVAIESSTKIAVTAAFSYQDGSLQQTAADSITFNGLRLHAYSESSDFPIYQFHNNQLRQVRTAQADSYYQRKFALLNANLILQQIKSDGCLNGDQFYSSDICMRRIPGYCFEFNSITPKKDNAYWLLKQMCATRD